MENLTEILDAATEIAQQGSEMALSYFRKAILIEIKENLTPVTIADKKTEEFMRKELIQAFPGFGILVISFGLLGKDGLVVICGIITGLTGIAISITAILIGVEALAYIKNLF